MGRIGFWQHVGVMPFLSTHSMPLARPFQNGGQSNPVLLDSAHRAAIRRVIEHDGTLLCALRYHKATLARVMRTIKPAAGTIAGRAALVLSAIAALSGVTGRVAAASYATCNRFLMLAAQHDDAIQACPAASMADL